MTFGQNLKEVREFLGMTQADLAERIGVTAGSICQIESGQREPQLSTIVKILKAIPVDEDI